MPLLNLGCFINCCTVSKRAEADSRTAQTLSAGETSLKIVRPCYKQAGIISASFLLTDFYACNLPQKFLNQTERKSELCKPGKTISCCSQVRWCILSGEDAGSSSLLKHLWKQTWSALSQSLQPQQLLVMLKRYMLLLIFFSHKHIYTYLFL